MRVREIMIRYPVVVGEDDPIGHAAASMAEYEVGILPVVGGGQSRRLQGVITDRDITVRHVAWNHDGSCSVADHMTSGEVVTAHELDPVEDLIRRMRRTGLRRMPVVDGDGRLVGIVSRTDLEPAAP